MDSKSPEEKLGEKIKERRKALKMSQAALAKAVGLIQGKISQIELGERRIDMLSELPEFARALEKPVEWFIGTDDSEESSPLQEITLQDLVRQHCPALGSLSDEQLSHTANLFGAFIQALSQTDPVLQSNKKSKSNG